jgi:hypothetical protein
MGPPENTRALINNIISLTRTLPTSVPLATDADKIFAVMNSPEGESTWHKFNKDHEQDFLIISCMACDFLAIPGASVSVERLFSKSRHLCTDLQGSLHVAIVTEAMCARQ